VYELVAIYSNKNGWCPAGCVASRPGQ